MELSTTGYAANQWKLLSDAEKLEIKRQPRCTSKQRLVSLGVAALLIASLFALDYAATAVKKSFPSLAPFIPIVTTDKASDRLNRR